MGEIIIEFHKDRYGKNLIHVDIERFHNTITGYYGKLFVDKFLKKYGKVTNFSIVFDIIAFKVSDKMVEKFIKVLENATWGELKTLSRDIDNFNKNYKQMLSEWVIRKIR